MVSVKLEGIGNDFFGSQPLQKAKKRLIPFEKIVTLKEKWIKLQKKKMHIAVGKVMVIHDPIKNYLVNILKFLGK